MNNTIVISVTSFRHSCSLILFHSSNRSATWR